MVLLFGRYAENGELKNPKQGGSYNYYFRYSDTQYRPKIFGATFYKKARKERKTEFSTK
jgi:hypothetical protein